MLATPLLLSCTHSKMTSPHSRPQQDAQIRLQGNRSFTFWLHTLLPIYIKMSVGTSENSFRFGTEEEGGRGYKLWVEQPDLLHTPRMKFSQKTSQVAQ